MDATITTERKWREVITPKRNVWGIDVKEIWNYRDLMFIWMRRDILAVYKQTILGPLWFVAQPILTTLVYIIIFSRVAKLSTTSLPPALFYLSGIIVWGYFAECITKTATFFKDSSAVMSKVYFPRLIIPLSLVFTNLVKFSIQFVLFLVVYFYFFFTTYSFGANAYIFLFPLLIVLIAGLGLASGMIISSLTIRYKDFVHLIMFGVQLLMFTTSVFFPVSSIEDSFYKTVMIANPMTGIIEAFRYGFTGVGYFRWDILIYDAAFMMVLLVIAILLFNRVEGDFVDNI